MQEDHRADWPGGLEQYSSQMVLEGTWVLTILWAERGGCALSHMGSWGRQGFWGLRVLARVNRPPCKAPPAL